MPTPTEIKYPYLTECPLYEYEYCICPQCLNHEGCPFCYSSAKPCEVCKVNLADLEIDNEIIPYKPIDCKGYKPPNIP
jgi:hypothetical protein